MKISTSKNDPSISWHRSLVDTELVGARAQSYKNWLDNRNAVTPLLGYNAVLATDKSNLQCDIDAPANV